MNLKSLVKNLPSSFEAKVESGLIMRLVLILYLILGLSLLGFYQYKLFPDSISHLSIAQKYQVGNFKEAINGYWSPLYSCLLVPFLAVGLSPLLSAKLLYLIVGLLTIIGIEKLSFRFNISANLRGLILLSMIPQILYSSLILITPDFLLVCLLVHYLNLIFAKDYFAGSLAGILCGFLGGFAYLCKTYALPFFLFHFFLLNGLHFFAGTGKEDKKKVVRHLFLGLTVFLMICGPWIAAISGKTKELTIGTTVKYNYALTGPNVEELSRGDKGLVVPPNTTAPTAWEDPGAYKIPNWSPILSWETFALKVKRIVQNLVALLLLCLKFSLFSPVIFGAYVVFSLPKPFSKQRVHFLMPVVTIALYFFGYSFFWVSERHFWIFPVLLILMGGVVLTHFSQKLRSLIPRLMLISFFLFSFMPFPLIGLAKGFGEGKEIFSLSQKLNSLHKIEGNTASYGRFKRPLYLSYYLDCQYQGKLENGISVENLIHTLKYHKVNYFFIWDNPGNRGEKISNFLLTQKEITLGKFPGMEVYAMDGSVGVVK